LNFLNLIHVIRRFILKRSAIFGQQGLDSTIGRWLLKIIMISYGFGSALTTNMNDCLKSDKKKYGVKLLHQLSLKSAGADAYRREFWLLLGA
jgi:hypothetical protein